MATTQKLRSLRLRGTAATTPLVAPPRPAVAVVKPRARRSPDWLRHLAAQRTEIALVLLGVAIACALVPYVAQLDVSPDLLIGDGPAHHAPPPVAW